MTVLQTISAILILIDLFELAPKINKFLVRLAEVMWILCISENSPFQAIVFILGIVFMLVIVTAGVFGFQVHDLLFMNWMYQIISYLLYGILAGAALAISLLILSFPPRGIVGSIGVLIFLYEAFLE